MSFSEEIEILQESPDQTLSYHSPVPPSLEVRVGPWCHPSLFRPCIVFTFYLIVLFGIAIVSFTIYIHYSEKFYAPLTIYIGFLTTFVGVIVLSTGIFRLMDYYLELQDVENTPPPVIFPLLKGKEKGVEEEKRKEKDNERKEEEEGKDEEDEGKEVDRRKKEEEKGELYECVVCRSNHRDVFSRRCRHISMCIECANRNNKCPICTAAYQRSDLVRIFFS